MTFWLQHHFINSKIQWIINDNQGQFTTLILFFKMRNYKEIQTMIEELSALLVRKNLLMVDKNIHNAKKTLLEIYEKATEEKYSFLFVNLMESNINDVFKIRFDKKIMVDFD